MGGLCKNQCRLFPTGKSTVNDALRIAVVGSGPAALYAAAELAKQLNPIVKVNMIERLPSIGGLVRAGVAPDHADRRLIIDA